MEWFAHQTAEEVAIQAVIHGVTLLVCPQAEVATLLATLGKKVALGKQLTKGGQVVIV